MLKTLTARLTLALLLLLVTTGIIAFGLFVRTNRLYASEMQQQLNRDLAAHIVAEGLLLQDGDVNAEALEHVFHMMMVVHPSIELYLLDTEGELVGFSDRHGKVQLRQLNLTPIKRFIELGISSKQPLMGPNPRNPDEMVAFSAAPILSGDELEGYLYVVLDGEAYRGASEMLRESFATRIGGAWLLIVIISIALSGWILFRLVTRRLTGLERRVRKFEADGFRTPFAAESPAHLNDEVARLERSVSLMSVTTVEQFQRLESSDQERRELIANISHDLRTPLASLKGCLDTMHDQADRLEEDERARFVSTCVKQCNRLRDQIEDLFELATLDSAGVQIEQESFSPAELVQDVLQKFELRAKSDGIELSMRLEPDLPLAIGDIGLIERALGNLIDNALRHTPADGAVRLSVGRREDQIRIEVRDTGCGIDQTEIPHLFERYYRIASDGDRRGVGGLGLAIVKRILDLHETTIGVESELGRGSTFRFELPVSA